MSSEGSSTREVLAGRKLTFRLNNSFRTLALCLAMGMEVEEAAAQIGVEVGLAEMYLRDPRLQGMYDTFMLQIEAKAIERIASKRHRACAIFQTTVERAANTVVELMDNGQNENVRLRAAAGVLNQSGIDLSSPVRIVGEGEGEEVHEEDRVHAASVVKELEDGKA